jgi:hypothetical protein
VPFGQYDLCVEAGGKIFKETYAAAVGTTPVKGIDNSPSAGVTKTVKMTTANGSCP